MIIHAPEIDRRDGEVIVSTRVEMNSADGGVPSILWVAFPERYETALSGRADGFAAMLVLLAMRKGESLQVRGKLSPRLFDGLNQYQEVFHRWFPDQFQKVAVRCGTLETNERLSKPAVLCAFSGGVDSLFTLRTHLPANTTNATDALSHALFVHGFDIPLEDTTTYYEAREEYERLMRDLKLELVSARTNVRQFVDSLNWEMAHGSALAGVALLLDRLAARFLVPASHAGHESFPWGSHPATDCLLSTETMEVVHDGMNVGRLQKTAAIADWTETFRRLRVCWTRPRGLMNCCRCEKCLRTMVTLDLMGALPNFVTFPLPLDRRALRRCQIADANTQAFAREILKHAWSVGRRDVVFDICVAMVRSRVDPSLYRLKQSLASMRHGRPREHSPTRSLSL